MLAQLLRNKGLLVGVGLVLFLVVALGVFAVRPPAPPTRSTAPFRQHESGREQAQEILGKATDANSCRTALQQLNVHLSQHPDLRPSPLTEETRKLLTDPAQLALTPEQLAEVENGNFTGLDAHHLELCFLLRDAARSLDVEGLSQPEQAGAAFDWVVRQVRLVDREEGPVPSDFVLHRGWGTSRERAVIFVALLDQLGIPGCVLAAGDRQAEPPQPWACGALADLPGGKEKEVFLFDPRLGLPLPGPKDSSAGPELAGAFRLGSPVPVPGDSAPATLAALRRQPDALKALTVDDKHPYDVTAERLDASRLYLVAPLSALAPRMTYLQEELSSVRGGARVAFDPSEALQTWTAVAAEQGGKAPEVRFWREAATSAYDFWPAEEGGGDRTQRSVQRAADLVPWGALPRQIAQLPGDPGRRLQNFFAQSFAGFDMAAGMPPDLVLRGESDNAAQMLVKSLDQMRENRDRLQGATDLEQKMNDWCGLVVDAQAEVSRAQADVARSGGKDRGALGAQEEARAALEEVWKNGQDVAGVLIAGRAAEVEIPDVTYLLALCKQEQAERLQLQAERARRSGRSGAEGLAEAAKDAWADAGFWWGKYAAEPATALGGQAAPRRSSPAAARLLQARARLALGERDQAVRQLGDLSDLTGPEQTARLYLARRLQKP
jgi:hypothetical protein